MTTTRITNNGRASYIASVCVSAQPNGAAVQTGVRQGIDAVLFQHQRGRHGA